MSRSLIQFALAKFADRVSVLPFDGLLLDAARTSPRRGLPARITLAVPDDLVKNLVGAKDGLRDSYYVVRVPREVVDREKSRIILPGEP